MRELQVGDYVRIIKDSVSHYHPIGTVCRLKRHVGGYFWATDYNGMWVPTVDIKLVLDFKDYYDESRRLS